MAIKPPKYQIIRHDPQGKDETFITTKVIERGGCISFIRSDSSTITTICDYYSIKPIR